MLEAIVELVELVESKELEEHDNSRLADAITQLNETSNFFIPNPFCKTQDIVPKNTFTVSHDLVFAEDLHSLHKPIGSKELTASCIYRCHGEVRGDSQDETLILHTCVDLMFNYLKQVKLELETSN